MVNWTTATKNIYQKVLPRNKVVLSCCQGQSNSWLIVSKLYRTICKLFETTVCETYNNSAAKMVKNMFFSFFQPNLKNDFFLASCSFFSRMVTLSQEFSRTGYLEHRFNVFLKIFPSKLQADVQWSHFGVECIIYTSFIEKDSNKNKNKIWNKNEIFLFGSHSRLWKNYFCSAKMQSAES